MEWKKKLNIYFCFFEEIVKLCLSLFCIQEIFGYDIRATAFLNVQKAIKINIQWTKKRGGKETVFKRSK